MEMKCKNPSLTFVYENNKRANSEQRFVKGAHQQKIAEKQKVCYQRTSVATISQNKCDQISIFILKGNYFFVTTLLHVFCRPSGSTSATTSRTTNFDEPQEALTVESVELCSIKRVNNILNLVSTKCKNKSVAFFFFLQFNKFRRQEDLIFFF